MRARGPCQGGKVLKVLISGTSGFIGTSVAERLSREKQLELAGFDRVEPKERFPGVRYFYGDLRDTWASLPDALDAFRPDAVVHLAAQARVDPSLTDPFGTYDMNVLGTLNLARACSKLTPPPHFVYASSEAIYGQADNYPTRENDHFRPISPYASSKIAADVMVQQLNGRLGMRTCVLRSGMGMGPRSDPRAQVVSKFIVKALEGKPIMFPAGSVVHPTRDINPVWNFVEAVKLVLEAKATGVYNIASGREIGILEVASKVLDAVGKRQVEDLGGLLRFSPEFAYREGEAGMRTWLDITKARAELGYEPKVMFEDALPPTIEWMEANKDSYWETR